jgi:hypothetical protein
MCKADICNTCRCTKFRVSKENYQRSSTTSSFVESGLNSSIYCSNVLLNLRTFLLTAVVAFSSSSRLVVSCRAPTQKTTSCRRRQSSWEPCMVLNCHRSCGRRICRCGGVSCAARVVVGGSIKRASSVTGSRGCEIIVPRVHGMILSLLTGPWRSRTSADLSGASPIDQCPSYTLLACAEPNL